MGDQQDAGAAELPVALCAEILRHVPQQDRLGLCALVCRAWASAAIQATVNLEKEVEKEHLPALQGWLAQHSGQLQTLKLFGYSWGEEMLQLQLPWDKMIRLQHLKLNGFTQLPGEEDRPCNSPHAGSWDCSSGGNSSACAEWPELPSLRKLELSRVKLLDISSIFQLTNAPQLRSLILKSIEFTLVQFASFHTPGCKVDVQIVAQAIPYLLQRLPQLSVLKLPLFPFTDAAVQQAAALQGLQELSITQAAFVPACHLQQLPSTITRLQLSEDRPFVSPSPQDLFGLPGLLHLKLGSCTVPPTLLASVTQLQQLSLQECDLLPKDMYSGFMTPGTVALLEALTKLTSLRDLRLRDQLLDTRGTIISPQHFSALTASSQLTGLTLVPRWGSGCMPLPCGAVQHMLPPGRQLQSLQHLTISTGDRRDACCLDSDDLSCVVASCPQLHMLDVGGSVQQGVDWSVMLQLPACCTQLRLKGAAFADAAVPVLAQLTQLADLVINWSPGFSDAGLEQLVGTNLTQLWVQGAGLSSEVTSAPFSGGPCEDPTVLLLKPDPKLVSAGGFMLLFLTCFLFPLVYSCL